MALRKCHNCVFCAEDGVVGLGGAMYWINYCEALPHKPRLIDAGIERYCPLFQSVGGTSNDTGTTSQQGTSGLCEQG